SRIEQLFPKRHDALSRGQWRIRSFSTSTVGAALFSWLPAWLRDVRQMTVVDGRVRHLSRTFAGAWSHGERVAKREPRLGSRARSVRQLARRARRLHARGHPVASIRAPDRLRDAAWPSYRVLPDLRRLRGLP